MNIIDKLKQANLELFTNIENILKITDESNLNKSTSKINKLLCNKNIALKGKLYIKEINSRKYFSYWDEIKRIYYNPPQQRIFLETEGEGVELKISMDILTKNIYYIFDNGKIRIDEDEVDYRTNVIKSNNIFNDVSVSFYGKIKNGVFEYETISGYSDNTYDNSDELKANATYNIAFIIKKYNIDIEAIVFAEKNESVKIQEAIDLEMLNNDFCFLKEFLEDPAIYGVIKIEDLKIKEVHNTIKEKIKRKFISSKNKRTDSMFLYKYK